MILCWLKWRKFLGDHVCFRGCACEPNTSQAFMYRICTGIVYQPHGCHGYYCESLGVQTVCVFFNNFRRLDPKAARDRGFSQLVNIHHRTTVDISFNVYSYVYVYNVSVKKTYQSIHLKHYFSRHVCPSSPLNLRIFQHAPKGTYPRLSVPTLYFRSSEFLPFGGFSRDSWGMRNRDLFHVLEAKCWNPRLSHHQRSFQRHFPPYPWLLLKHLQPPRRRFFVAVWLERKIGELFFLQKDWVKPHENNICSSQFGSCPI